MLKSNILKHGPDRIAHLSFFLFEPELALLVGLQVVSSKEGELSDKFFGSLSQKPKQGCRTGWKG